MSSWWWFGNVSTRLDQILQALQASAERETKLMALVDDLVAEVAQDTDTMSKAMTLLGHLHDLLIAAQTDPTKLQDAITALSTGRQQLANAITADTQ